MAMTTTTVRLDTDTKAAFDRLCKEFGMSVNTAITIFVNKVVEERRIPFTIGKEEDARRMRLLDRLTGAWKEDGETGNLVRSIRDARSFGNTRHTKDF